MAALRVVSAARCLIGEYQNPDKHTTARCRRAEERLVKELRYATEEGRQDPIVVAAVELMQIPRAEAKERSLLVLLEEKMR